MASSSGSHGWMGIEVSLRLGLVTPDGPGWLTSGNSWNPESTLNFLGTECSWMFRITPIDLWGLFCLFVLFWWDYLDHSPLNEHESDIITAANVFSVNSSVVTASRMLGWENSPLNVGTWTEGFSLTVVLASGRLSQLLPFLRWLPKRSFYSVVYNSTRVTTLREYSLHCGKPTGLNIPAIGKQYNDFLLSFSGTVWGTAWLGFPGVFVGISAFICQFRGAHAGTAVNLAMRFPSSWYLTGNITVAYHSFVHSWNLVLLSELLQWC